MYHYLSKIIFSYGCGLTSGISLYSLLIYSDLEKQFYWDRIFNGKILSASLSAFSVGCYIGFNSDPQFKCMIPYQYFKE